jgi:hypothetical protein
MNKQMHSFQEHNRCWMTNGLNCRDHREKCISQWHSWQESIPFSPSAPAAPEARPPWAKPTAGLQPPVLGEARSILSIFSSSFVYCGMVELLFDIDIIYDI